MDRWKPFMIWPDDYINKIICGDCLEVMKGIPDGAVDCVITDPPYGVGYQGGHFHSGDVNIKRHREKLANDENSDIYYPLLEAIKKVTKGPCYIFFSGTKAFEVYDAARINKFDIHALIIWHKTNATYAAMNSQYKHRHEPILYCKPRGWNTLWCGPTDECTVWDMKRNPENIHHPTQKPVDVIKRMIRNHNIDIILDPFCGSGTTCVAAKQMGRKYIGIEINPEYAAIAQRRVDNVGHQLEVF
jgi:DNA modification methylase